MQMGMIGLGKMGANMAERLLEHGHAVVGYDLKEAAVAALRAEGGSGAATLAELVAQLERPRNLWVMVPAGNPVEQTIQTLVPLLDEGDLVIDGGNSNYKDSVRRGAMLAEQGIGFMDAGVSGGVWGLENGYCLMVGGERAFVERVEPMLICLSPSHDTAHTGPEAERPTEQRPAVRGYAHVGPVGAGHFVKMIHNGIEYGMMQAYAEGFELMHAKEEFALDMAQIADLWMHGSVVRSWLLELTARAFEQEGSDLAALDGWVNDSGEGRWTVTESIDLAVPAPVITLALQMRFRSRQPNAFGSRIVAAMRNQFGGHALRRVDSPVAEQTAAATPAKPHQDG